MQFLEYEGMSAQVKARRQYSTFIGQIGQDLPLPNCIGL